MLAVMTLCMMTCSNDENSAAMNYGTDIAKVYNGYTKSTAQYFPDGMYATGEKLEITREGDNKVNIGYVSETFGTFEIKNATVSKNGATYKVEGTGTTIMGMNGTGKSYECSLSAEVSASGSTFRFTVPAVMGGMTVDFIEGDAPANVMVTGSYEGMAKAVAQYFPQGMTSENQTVTVKVADNGKVNISYTSDTWGTFTINDATVTMNGDIYTIEGAGSCLMGMSEESKKEYPCTLKASIDSEKNSPEFVFSVPSVMGGLTITWSPASASASN